MYVALMMLSIICGISGHVKEPQCTSYFDYEQKLLYKLIKIEEEVKDFRLFIENMKSSQEKKDQEHEKIFEATLAQFQTAGKKQMDDMKLESNKVLTDLEEKLSDLTASAEKLKNAQAVGFSMHTPKQSPVSGQLTFTEVITNVGNGFDVGSGVFTCKTPGYYYFSASLLKQYNHASYTFCYIRKNGVSLVRAYTQPGHTSKKGYSAFATGVYVHLAARDNVTLAGCTSLSSIETAIESSFSGFLVTPDVV